MKKSKAITLVLVTGILGCSRPAAHNRLYLRTDSSGYYTRGATGYHGYYIFRPYGTYYGGRYMRMGYSNSGVHTSEAGITRGGFGGSKGFSVSS
ncbi:MAG: hypothetical protein JWQ06_561 [Mucilaginibacter sp.]|jgi:hypothetical protein|nr:hypothetical protein [Mucilaginibacter sp.]